LKNLKSPSNKIETASPLLKIGGFLPFSLLDYPNHLSAVLFCQGCCWRCRYCHNVQLQPIDPPHNQKWDWEKILSFLHQRQGILDAVVFSGGEPLLQPYLIHAIKKVKNLGFKIGLHSAGTSAHHFASLLAHVDWVGLDVKAPLAKYPEITQDPKSGKQSWRCMHILIESGVPYEFRTTIHPLLHTEEDIWEIAQKLHQMGATHYAIQYFQEQGCVDKALVQKKCFPYLKKQFLRKLHTLFDNFTIR